MIPIGESEKAYVIENGERVVLIRGNSSKNYPFTPDDAYLMAVGAKEIGPKEFGWVVREVDDAGLEEARDRLAIYLKKNGPRTI